MLAISVEKKGDRFGDTDQSIKKNMIRGFGRNPVKRTMSIRVGHQKTGIRAGGEMRKSKFYLLLPAAHDTDLHGRV